MGWSVDEREKDDGGSLRQGKHVDNVCDSTISNEVGETVLAGLGHEDHVPDLLAGIIVGVVVEGALVFQTNYGYGTELAEEIPG